MSRVCQLCLPQLWSDELSPVNSGREGCVGRAWSGREAGMSQAWWTVPMKAGGRRSRYRRSKCLPLGPGERTQRAAPTHTHTHTHMCTLDLAGSERTPPAILENSTCYAGHFSTGSWNPGSWHPASCLLLKLYLKTGGGLVAKMCPTLMTPWTVAFQASLSMGFSRQEYWSWLPYPPPGDLPDPRIEPGSPAFQADSLPTELRGKPIP